MKRSFKRYQGEKLDGPRFIVEREGCGYPDSLLHLDNPPERLYGIGDPEALSEGIAIVGARKATPYGIACAQRFARLAAEKGIAIVSGGARGCDAAAHEAALQVAGRTVAFLGGGCDELYPAEHYGLFQRIVDGGGAVVSECAWSFPPLPHTFRARNRLIAGLAKATLIVEAGLPSGTFSTADEALSLGKEVLVVPGSILSPSSHGANRLLSQGALPIIDDETFEDALFNLFGALKNPRMEQGEAHQAGTDDAVLAALRANPMHRDEIVGVVRSTHPCDDGGDALTVTMVKIAELERDRLIARYPDGRYGAI